jgi:hypothetical protein
MRPIDTRHLGILAHLYSSENAASAQCRAPFFQLQQEVKQDTLKIGCVTAGI